MMPDNLSVSITADTSKLRQELKVAEAALRSLRTEERKAADEAARAGDVSRIAKVTPQVIAAERAVARLREEWTRANRTMEISSREVTKLAGSLGNMHKSAHAASQILFDAFGGGLAAGGIAAGILVAAHAAERFAEYLNSITEEMIKIRDLGREIGAKPLAIQAAEDIAKAVGASAEDADKMLKGVAESLTKIRTQAGATIGPVATLRGSVPGDQAGGPTVLRGDTADQVKKTGDTLKDVQSTVQGGVAVLRSGSQLVFDLAHAYQMLSIDLTKYKGTQEDVLKLQKDTFAAFQRASTQKIFDPTQLNELSKVLFQGVPSQTALEVIPAELAHIDEQMRKLADSARGVTKANEEIIQNWQASKNRLDTIFKDLFAGIETARLQSETSMNEWSANFLEKTLPAWAAGVRQFFTNFWPNLVRDLQSNLDTFNENLLRNTGETLNQLLARWQSYFTSVMQMIGSAASAAASGIGNVLSQAGQSPGVALTPYAEGGYVAGPGSGTSDSILARVSNGEFVMRAAAVDHWGPAFMNALNGLRDPFRFAMGGMVGDLRSFADGGYVAATSGTPVHLHLNGQSFQMTAAPTVASALIHEAGREQLRSAGIKPSWYGGRPGS